MRPSIGRIVLVRYKEWGELEFPAIINRVWTDICINVMAFPDGPSPMSLSSILMTEDFDNSGQHAGWRWMPYQKAVAETDEHKKITSALNQ